MTSFFFSYWYDVQYSSIILYILSLESYIQYYQLAALVARRPKVYIHAHHGMEGIFEDVALLYYYKLQYRR